MSATTAPAAAACPSCGTAADGGPFCPRDGTILAPVPFTIGERYQVEELIGRGGFGFVFGGRHALLGRAVAVKVLRPEYARDELPRRRFLREARTASQLVHEHIVGVLDFGVDAELDVTYLVMDRVAGSTLAHALADGQPMPVARALPILLKIARALAAAHAAGVVHRDLNPRNILLVPAAHGDEGVKLCDFGLSRLIDGRDRVTRAGVVMGTPAYMAPEQLRGDGGQDHRVDLHAFGVTAFELLTGRRPFAAATPAALIARKLSTDPERTRELPIDGVPPEVEALVQRCLERDPAARPASADELIAVIGDACTAARDGEVRARALPSNLVGQRVGHHVINRLIETGGLGAVYEGEHPIIGTRVAVKVLLPDAVAIPGMSERFILEARLSGRIDSPHMPRYLDFGHLPGGRPYAVMELLVGETLAQRIEQGPLPVAEAGEIVGQLAAVLGLAHRADIIHRDVKPANIFLTRGEGGARLVKLLDFGIAKALTSPGDGARTAVGMMMGTPYYCAPEQALGLEVGPAADVYALGVTLYEMLSGQLPFDGQLTQVLGAKTTTEAPPLSGLPAEVVATVAAMLVRDPSGRLATMAAVTAAVAGWGRASAERTAAVPTATVAATPSNIGPTPPTAAPWSSATAVPPARRGPRSGVLIAVGGAVAAAIALGAGWTWRPGRARPAPAVMAPAVVTPAPALVSPSAVMPLVVPAPDVSPPARPEPAAAAIPAAPRARTRSSPAVPRPAPPAAPPPAPAAAPSDRAGPAEAVIVDPFEGSVRTRAPAGSPP